MGQRTDAIIREFQRRAGLTPANGEYLETLDRMSKLAYELIQLIELEESGIRDGDGQWHGSDPIGSTVRELVDAERLSLKQWKESKERDQLCPDPNGLGPHGLGSDVLRCEACNAYATTVVNAEDLAPAVQ